MVVIWAALLMSQVLFLVLVFFTRPELFRFRFTQPILGDSGPAVGSSPAIVLGFIVGAVTAVLFSFAFKKRLYDRAIEEQNPAHAQTGLVIALALCEASTLFGLTLAFAFDYQYFFLWIGLAIVAMIAHFPKRDVLHAASIRRPDGK